MKWLLLLFVTATLALGIGFAGATFLLPKGLLNDYNRMANDNFHTALALFRDQYNQRRVIVFGEKDVYTNFHAGEIQFQIIPASKTMGESESLGLSRDIGNTATHLNGMSVVLACRWIQDGDPSGKALLTELQKYIPNTKASAPSMTPVRIAELKEDSPLVQSEANQWDWRMESD